MKKYFCAISILVVLALPLIWPRAAAAADIEWQLHWLDNNKVQEEIQTSAQNFITTDTNWNVSQEGDKHILRREVDNWQSYEAMTDKLPLQVQQKNYLLYKKTEIKPNSEAATGLFQQLSNEDNLILTITVPGFIMGGSGEKIGESSAQWIFPNHADLLQRQEIMTVITMDGLLLGVVVVLLGMLFVAIRFFIGLRKVERIIASEYALTKINEDNDDQEDRE